MTDGPYTTIRVEEYIDLMGALRAYRHRIQKARVLLENGHAAKALEVLREQSTK